MSKKVRGKWKLPPLWSGPFSFLSGGARDPDTVYGCKKNGFWPGDHGAPEYNTPQEAVDAAWETFCHELEQVLGWTRAQWEAIDKLVTKGTEGNDE